MVYTDLSKSNKNWNCEPDFYDDWQQTTVRQRQLLHTYCCCSKTRDDGKAELEPSDIMNINCQYRYRSKCISKWPKRGSQSLERGLFVRRSIILAPTAECKGQWEIIGFWSYNWLSMLPWWYIKKSSNLARRSISSYPSNGILQKEIKLQNINIHYLTKTFEPTISDIQLFETIENYVFGTFDFTRLVHFFLVCLV